ncbi:MAG: histidine phosphatase family protein [Clostridia bacterium]|nr:histidine phosphatase family protein [Clostridia bacterium]
MTRLIVVRHGESEANRQQRFAGSWDVNLTDLGRRQAQLVAEYLKSYDIDKVYASNLTRAMETARPIAESHGLTVETEVGVREIHGGAWEEMYYIDILKKYGDDYNVWLTDIGNAKCTDGESVMDLSIRIDEALKRIVSENDGKTVCIVCHGTPVRVMSCLWKGEDVHNLNSVSWAANASVSIAEYKDADSLPEVKMYGYTEHLADCVTRLPDTV